MRWRFLMSKGGVRSYVPVLKTGRHDTGLNLIHSRQRFRIMSAVLETSRLGAKTLRISQKKRPESGMLPIVHF